MPQSSDFSRTERTPAAIACLLCIALSLLTVAASLLLGASKLTPAAVWNALLHPSADSQAAQILYLVRLPRLIACILCGGALAASGLLIQTVLHTPLASPGIIGVNAGAGFAVVLAAFLFQAAFLPRILAAFAGALAAVMLVYGIAHKTGASRLTIVLAGVAVSSLLTAATDALITINPSAILDKAAFSMGGFSGIGLRQVSYTAPLVIGAVTVSLFLSRHFEILTMGDEIAASLGVPVRTVRFFALFLAAILAACAVSMGGLIGFVGLIAPHISRLLFRTSYKKLILFSFWFGSLLMLICDLLARTLFRPYEIPTGIVLSVIGAPFFLFLLLTRRGERV